MERTRMKIKRLVNVFIPVSVCNFECRYCYIPQCEGRKKNLMPNWKVDPKTIGKALSKERLGGVCFMNVCGDGETLLPKETPEIIKELLIQGHVLEVVTNGTLSNRFDEIFKMDRSLLDRLEFKFSYHYEQLINKKMHDIFWNNVKNARKHGCSITIELTPHDELIPLIPEIKKDCIDNAGALCHITTTFNYEKDFALFTKLTKEQFVETWSQFKSPMLDFKMSVLNIKRKEYCYAGEYLMSVDIASGIARQCYCGRAQDIYKNINKPLKWNAIGKHCSYSMCFNAHALMVFGAIPDLAKDIHYSDIRNRVCADGSEWLSDTVKDAFNSKFIESNKLYNPFKKIINEIVVFIQRVMWKIKH